MKTENKKLIKIPKLPKFIKHKIAGCGSEDAKNITAVKQEYLMAGNGLFVRAKRKEFGVSLPISNLKIAGLEKEQAGVFWNVSKIKKKIWSEILEDARCRLRNSAEFKEDVYVICRKESGWQWRRISRMRGYSSTIADDSLAEYADAAIELHTHPEGVYNFSSADDLDERGKFRIFGILIDLQSPKPKIRFRCGVYEHFVQIPARFIGELPGELVDLNILSQRVGGNAK